jgi:hypothetical protein
MRLFGQSFTLLSAMLLVILIVYTPLADYMAPILGFLIVVSLIFIIIKKRSKKDQELFIGSNKEIFMITSALMLAIFITGGLQSSLFFLLYFLLFGIVFVFEPETVFVLLVGVGAAFLQPLIEGGELIGNLIKIGSLVFLSPISYFFGKEFKRREKLEREIEDKTGQILEDADALLKTQSEKGEEDIDEIDDIIEKSNELRKEVEDEK